jgi:hypothetical protein
LRSNTIRRTTPAVASRAPDTFTALLLGSQARLGALADQLALVLGEVDHCPRHHAACGGRQVQVDVEHDQRPALCLRCINYVGRMDY